MKKIGKFLQKILYFILILLVAACAGILYYSTMAPEDKFTLPDWGLFGSTVSGDDAEELMESVSGGNLLDISGNNLLSAGEELSEEAEINQEQEAEPEGVLPLSDDLAMLIAADRAGLADTRVVFSAMPSKTLQDGTYYVFEDGLDNSDSEENVEKEKILVRSKDGQSTLDVKVESEGSNNSDEAADGTAEKTAEQIAQEIAASASASVENNLDLELPKTPVPVLDDRYWARGNANAGGQSVYSAAGKMEIEKSVGTGSFLIQGVKLKMNFGEAMTQIYDNNCIYDKVPSYRDDQIIATTTCQEGQGRDALLMADQMMFGLNCYILYDFNKDISGRQMHVLSPRVEGIKVMFREEIGVASVLEKLELMLGEGSPEYYEGLHNYSWYLADQQLQLRCIRSADGQKYIADAIVLSWKEE